MVPFYNWAGFESSTQVTNINQHFTIRTESFDAILATIRPGNYDSTGFNTGNSIGGTPQTAGSAMSNANWFIPQQGGSDPRATSLCQNTPYIRGITRFCQERSLPWISLGQMAHSVLITS